MKIKILLASFLIIFTLTIETVFASSTVSVNISDAYKITGESVNGIARYIMDLEKTGTQHGEKNMTIFDQVFGVKDRRRCLRIWNSTPIMERFYLTKAESTLIEQSPVRVYLRYENTSSSYGSSSSCWSSPEVVCWNFSVDYYFYPKFYTAFYKVWGNFTRLSLEVYSIPYQFFGILFNNSAGYYNNGTYGIINSLINESIIFAYNTTGHNKSFAVFSIAPKNIELNWSWYYYAPYTSEVGQTYRDPYGIPGNNFHWGYGMLFADSGNKSLAENETVWLGFKEQWFDIYYPASVSAINGNYQGRDNTTGTYNFTVANNGLLRFNFSTNGIKHFLPIFHIKDITSNSSVYKDHIWYKNYSKPNPQWEKLTNYTDFVIQDGNSSYFGYNYILLLINKTLGSDYEFWISNSSDPAGIFTRKITNWNKTLMIWNDTNQSSAFTLKYSITGLKPNCYYNVYNNSVLAYSMLYTDSQGNLPSFTIYLDSEKEIKVEEYPVVSVLLSDELVRGIFFTNKTGAEINTQYRVDLNDWNNATWNYNASDSNKKTEYWIQNNGTTFVDVCQKAENDLTCYPGEPCGSFTIAIANVSWSNSTYNNITFPEYDTSKRLALTYSTNKTAYSLSVGSSIYLRYWFFAPSAAPSGRYNTTISFKAVGAGEDC